MVGGVLLPLVFAVFAAGGHVTTIKTAQPWFDTSGNQIDAHGGGFYVENGTYFWYVEKEMEKKEKTDIHIAFSFRVQNAVHAGASTSDATF